MAKEWTRYMKDWTLDGYLRSETGPFLPRLQRDLTAWWGNHPDPDSLLTTQQIDGLARRLADYLNHYSSPITPPGMIERFWEQLETAPGGSKPGAAPAIPQSVF